MSTLPKRIAKLNTMGYTITSDYEYRGAQGARERVELPDTVEGVYLNFTDSEWVRMTQRDRDWYIGPCCGNTGYVQDVMAGVYRDGGFIDAPDLLRIGPLLSGHDGWEWTKSMDVDASLERMAHPLMQDAPPEETYYAHAEDEMPPWLDPWDRICVIYAALEPALKSSSLYDEPRAPRPEAEYSRLVDTARRISWGDMFSEPIEGERYEQQSDEHKAHARDRHGQRTGAHVLNVAKLVGPLRAVVERVEREPVFEGFALVTPGTDEVLENGYGPCVYIEREGAERMIELWSRMETEESKRRKHGEDVHEPEYVTPEAEIVAVEIDPKTGLKVKR